MSLLTKERPSRLYYDKINRVFYIFQDGKRKNIKLPSSIKPRYDKQGNIHPADFRRIQQFILNRLKGIARIRVMPITAEERVFTGIPITMTRPLDKSVVKIEDTDYGLTRTFLSRSSSIEDINNRIAELTRKRATSS